MNPSSITSHARVNYVFNMGDGIVGAETANVDDIQVRGPFPRGSQLTLASVTDGTSNTIMFGEISTTVGQGDPFASTTGDAAINPPVQGRAIILASSATAAGLPSMGVNECKQTARAGIYPTGTGTTRFSETQGSAWLRGLIAWTGFHTIIGPNGPSCVNPAGGTAPTANAAGSAPSAIRSAGSYHTGGAHVVAFDNAVKFIPNEIDSGDASGTAPGKNGGNQTPNWDSPSPFGVWGAMGTRGAGDDVSVMPGA
jgi:hypothetical protein